VDLDILLENVLNAVTAGVTIGCIYGLMCIGLGLIFGIMRIVNFAQGELLMLGMFASFYLVTGGKVLSFLGPYWGQVRRERSPGRRRAVHRAVAEGTAGGRASGKHRGLEGDLA
jgi:Branched-chain amino acid transport system / permease component